MKTTKSSLRADGPTEIQRSPLETAGSVERDYCEDKIWCVDKPTRCSTSYE
jgi:hypothetical protein